MKIFLFIFFLLSIGSSFALSVGVSPDVVVFDDVVAHVILQNPNSFDVEFELTTESVNVESSVTVDAKSQKTIALYYEEPFDEDYLFIAPKGLEVIPTLAIKLVASEGFVAVQESKVSTVLDYISGNEITGAAVGARKSKTWLWILVVLGIVIFQLILFKRKNVVNL